MNIDELKQLYQKKEVVKRKQKECKINIDTTNYPSNISKIDDSKKHLEIDINDIHIISDELMSFKRETIKLQLQIEYLKAYLQKAKKSIDYSCHVVYCFYGSSTSLLNYTSTVKVITETLFDKKYVKWVSYTTTKKEDTKLKIKIIKL